MWSPQRRLGTGFARQRFVFRMLCRFLLQSVRDLMCVIVRVFICIGVSSCRAAMIATSFRDLRKSWWKENDTRQSACMFNIPRWSVRICATKLASDDGQHYVIAAAFGCSSR